MTTRLRRYALAVIACLLAAGSPARANPAVVAAAQPAVGAVPSPKVNVPVIPQAVTLAQEVAEVPQSAAEILYLPMGVVECVLFPLPGLEFRSGLDHIGTGILAPFRLVEAVVTLPYDAVKAATDTVNSVPKAAGLPAVAPSLR
jgi:hypothetical protein